MDVLLRYTLMSITLKILMIEVVIIFICCLIIIVLKLYTKYKSSQEILSKRIISHLIIEALVNKKSPDEFTIPVAHRKFKILIESLEEFDQRIMDSSYIDIKHKILSKYLVPELNNYLTSRSWLKRQLAARCLLLNPQDGDKQHLSNLLHDSKFLVRIIAAVCITKISDQKLFEDVITTMSKESSLSRFSYRDALMQVNTEKFQWIENLLKKNINPTISAICLDLLSTRTTHNLMVTIIPFIYGQDRECKLLGIKILKNIPSIESFEILVHCLMDPDSDVRAESIKCLAFAYSKAAIPKIQELLNDPVWFVRLQAALFFKKYGNEGIRILSDKNLINEPKAYEIAQYVLALP